MYVEGNPSVNSNTRNGSSMDQGVNEATAALKGLLGIGGIGGVAGAGTASSPSSAQWAERDATQQLKATGGTNAKPDAAAHQEKPEQDETVGADQAKPQDRKAKKKRNRKKKEGSSNKQAGNGGNGASSNQKQSKKGGQKRRGKGGNDAAAAGKNSNAAPENYAWSAFQSSPDASKLPIPAFSSASAADDDDGDGSPIEDTGAVTKLFTKDSDEADGDSKSNSGKEASGNANNLADGKGLEESIQTSAHVTGSVAPAQPTQKDASDAPVSKTGINLAALSGAPATTAGVENQNRSVGNREGPTPIHMQQPVSTEEQMNQQHQNWHPHQQHRHHPNLQHQHQHQHQHQNLPPHSQMFQPVPQLPPAYMTIQVQVPMTLLPGRQMIVTAPNGLTVQIVVPQGVPPGAIIPVHIPTVPMPMMPTGGPGMPPYGHQSYHHQFPPAPPPH